MSALMKTKWQLFAVGLGLLFGGCVVQSIHPLFTEKEYIRFPGLIGTWVQKDGDRLIGTWTFAADGARYELTQTDEKGRKAAFTVSAGRIGTNIFLQASPRGPSPELNDLFTLHLVPAHLFVKAVKTDDGLRLLAMDVEWLTRHLEANPRSISHTIHDKTPLITASPDDLKKFVARHADDSAVFKNEIKLLPSRAGN